MSGGFPKSTCRVGQADGNRKIFIEEYVISFLQETLKKKKEPQMLVFYGDGYERDGCRYYFLKGVASHRTLENSFKKMDEFYFQTVGKKYFSDLIGIGWYYATGENKEILEILQNMKEQDFGDAKGYYIYFEQNPGMEEYMLHHGEKEKNEGAVEKKKKPSNSERHIKPVKCQKNKKIFEQISPLKAVQVLNMVSLCILIICCIIAVTTLNQYDKMKRLEETVTYLEISMDEQKNLPEE